MRKLILTLLSALTLASCAGRDQSPGKGFEGTITEVIQLPGLAEMAAGRRAASDSDNDAGGAAMLGAASNMTLKMYVRENKLAYDISLLGGLISMRSIIDRNARTLTVLLPTHSAMVMDLRSIDSVRGKIDDTLRAHSGIFDSLAAMLPQPTGAHEKIQGIDAEEYKATNGANEVDVWLSSNEKVKAFEIIRDAFLGRGHMGAVGGIDQIFAMLRPVAGKIPVRFESKMNGKTFVKGEMTEITEEKLSDDIFEIPKDYQIVNGDSMRHRSGDAETPGAAVSHDTTSQHRHITGP